MTSKLKSFSSTYFIMFLFFCLTSVSGQEKQSSIPDSLLSKASNELGELIKKSTPEEAKIYEKALFNLKDQDSAVTNEYYYIGRYFADSLNYKRSAYYFGYAAKAAERANYIMFLCSIYINQGGSYIKNWENEKALETYYKALNIAKKNNDQVYYINASSSIAIVNKRMNQFDKALEMINNALDAAETAVYYNGKRYKDSRNYIGLLITKSEILMDLEEYDSVLQITDRTIKICKERDDKELLVNIFSRKGRVLYFKKNFEEAYRYLFEARDLLVDGNVKNEIYFITLNYYLANCYYDQKAYQDAILHLEKSIDSLGYKYNNNFRFIDSHRLLANCYKAIGDNDQSVLWFDKYVELNASSAGNKDKIVGKIHNKEVKDLDTQIDDLKNQNEKGKRNTLYIALLSGMIVLALVVVTIRYYQKQRSNKKVFNALVEKISDFESQESQNTTTKSTKKIEIADDTVAKMLQDLDRLEQEQYFLRQECNLTTMSKKVKTNATYLSKIINTHKEKNFSTYINELRIDFVIDKLQIDALFRKYTIKAIAQDIGFKSAEAFTRAFKKKTGIYPSYFIKQVDKKQKV